MAGLKAEVAGLVAPLAAARWGGEGDPGRLRITSMIDINRGRGVFSRVLRVTIVDLRRGGGTDPLTVVVKVPVDGPNGEVARSSGACSREALAYRSILPGSPVRHPRAHRVVDLGDGGVALVLDDLSEHRQVDQLVGLDGDDALAVAHSLRRLHRHWAGSGSLAGLPVRRSVPSGLPPEGLAAGLQAIDQRWSAVVSARQRAAFHRLVARREELAEAFALAGPPTLCHGDPRADNLVFDPDGVPVLFDWQQLAVQFGPADLAWLAATSLAVDVRREIETDLVASYGASIDDYRLGLVLPGLAVLFLAQRHVGDDRSRRLVELSLSRIGTALVDLDPAG